MSNNTSFPAGRWGAVARQMRCEEDYIQAAQLGDIRYFAVFDGHGCNQLKEKDNKERYAANHAAAYARNFLHERIAAGLSSVDMSDEEAVKAAIVRIFVSFDEELREKNVEYGSTCTIVLIDDKNDKIYQVNLGDSRSMILKGTTEPVIVSATTDHRPYDPVEEQRIKNAGGSIKSKRVDGDLLISRSFGDFNFKMSTTKSYDPINGRVSAVPDVTVMPKSSGDVVILVSDGVYDRPDYTNETVSNLFVSEAAEAKEIADHYQEFYLKRSVHNYLEIKKGRIPSRDEELTLIREVDRICYFKSYIVDLDECTDKTPHILAARIAENACIRDDTSVIIVYI